MASDNIQYDSVMRLYSRKRNNNAALLESRRKEIMVKIPEYSAVEDEIAALSLQVMRYNLGVKPSEPIAADKVSWQLKTLNELKLQYLTSHGYPQDYLDEIYDCPDCHDTGIYNGSSCHCFKKAITDLMISQSGIAPILREENFSTLSEDYYSPNYIDPSSGKNSLEMFKDALENSRSFVANFNKEFRNLFFYGDTGVGKTFLSNCIAWELLNQGYSVVYMTSSDYFATMASYKFNRDEGDTIQLLDYINDCDLLIIDDLGTELANKFTASEFFSCINSRLLRRRSTIISTNLTLNQISELYTERVFSRIMSDYTLLKLTGDDIRIKKKLRQSHK